MLPNFFRPKKVLIVIGITIIAFALRYFGFDYISLDMQAYLLPWYEYIVAHEGYKALGDDFSNYTPPYLYLLTAMTYAPIALAPAAKIKLISVIFDFYAAVMMYKLVKLAYPVGNVPLLAYAAVLFAPTIILNSAYWGQADIIYTSLLLTSLYFICLQRPGLAIASFSVACAFKLQAVFFLPFLLALFLKRRIPWGYIVIPFLVYMVMIIPSFLLGRPLVDLLAIYFEQGETYQFLSMNAPNLYIFVPNSLYTIGVVVGLMVATVAGLGIGWFVSQSAVPFDNKILVVVATLSVSIMPFVLPKMHDRYFFPADLLSIGVVFYQPRLWFIPILFQYSSAMAYSVFLLGGTLVLLEIAAVLNTVTTILLLIETRRMLYP
jgi:Gpi18-like mannosyltransferase